MSIPIGNIRRVGIEIRRDIKSVPYSGKVKSGRTCRQIIYQSIRHFKVRERHERTKYFPCAFVDFKHTDTRGYGRFYMRHGWVEYSSRHPRNRGNDYEHNFIGRLNPVANAVVELSMLDQFRQRFEEIKSLK